MYQFNDLPNTPNIQTFNANGISWQTWNKPNDAMMIHILCIGGGGGSGGGLKSNTVGVSKSGGCGGGSGAITSMYVPAFLIPDILYIQVGLGGVGGVGATVNNTPGGGGTAGSLSYVALYPSYTGTIQVGNLLLSAAAGGAGAGAGTTGSTSCIGGTAGGTTTVGASSPFYLGLGQFTSTAGQAAGNTTGTTSASVTISGITCAGASGGGFLTDNVTFINAGAINSPSSLIPYLTSIPGGYADGGSILLPLEGNNGYAVKKPLMFVGGTGGGARTNNGAGRGGNGAIGSGAGGGGSALNGTGGAGGNGGNGIVIITSYSI